jgi:hypothetical protein
VSCIKGYITYIGFRGKRSWWLTENRMRVHEFNSHERLSIFWSFRTNLHSLWTAWFYGAHAIFEQRAHHYCRVSPWSRREQERWKQRKSLIQATHERIGSIKAVNTHLHMSIICFDSAFVSKIPVYYICHPVRHYNLFVAIFSLQLIQITPFIHFY